MSKRTTYVPKFVFLRQAAKRLCSLLACCLLFSVHYLACAQSETEPNNTPASATPLDLSSDFASVQGAIGSAADADYYSLTAPVGSRVWILVDTGGTPSPGSASTDSFLTLYDGTGLTVIEEDDDDGSGNGCDSTEESGFASAIAGRFLVSGGTYFIRVTEFGDDSALSPYRIFIALSSTSPTAEVEPNGTAVAPNALLTAGQSSGLRSASINQVGDVDFYSVEMEANKTILISADGDPERDGTGTDLELSLVAPDRSTILYTANSSADEGGNAEALCYTVPTTGTYYVRARHVSNGTGSYHLIAATRPPGTLQFSTAIYRGLESGGAVTIAVDRTGSSLGVVSVHYATANASAQATGDYQPASGTLFFGDGVTRQTFTVNLANDGQTEPNEYLNLVLTAPTGGAGLGPINVAHLVILDDDEAPNNSAATATPLSLQLGFAAVTNLAGAGMPAISPPGDQDWYSFKAPPNARVWALVDTGGAQSFAATSRDSQLTLFVGDGQTVLESDDDDGVGNGYGPEIDLDGDLASAIAGKLLTEGGTYYLRVRCFDAEGIIDPYRLFLLVSTQPALSEVSPNDSAAQASGILEESALSGHRLAQISPAGDMDWYAVPMSSVGFLWASIDADPYRSGNSADLVLDLIHPDGVTELISVDSSAADPASAESVAYQVDLPGTYYVRVRHFLQDGTGSYRLTVVRWPGDIEPNEKAINARTLSLVRGQASVSGTIGAASDIDTFKFTAGATTRLWATVDTGGPQSPGANSRASILTLQAADGTTVIEEDRNDGTGNGCDSTIETSDASTIAGRTLVAGGTYYLKMRATEANGIIDPYRLVVTVTSVSPQAEVEGNGTAASATPLLSELSTSGIRQGALSATSDTDFYSVFAAAGNLLHICADADPERDGMGTDLRLELIAPDGTTVLLDADSSTTGSLANPAAEGFCFQAMTSGVHYVRVRSIRNGTGSYLVMAARDTIPLRIVSRQIVGNDVRIGFYGSVGMNYRVERATGLSISPTWSPVTAILPGNDGIVVGTHLGGATQVQNFYRVVQVP